MRYSSFPGHINVEKTSKQCFRPPLSPENQKTVGGERKTQVRSQMVDKWTVRLNKEGLYNEVKPPEEGDQEIERKNIKKELLQYQEEHHQKQPFYLRSYPSDIAENNQFIQKLLLGPEIGTCLCVLFSSDKLLTSINCCKTLYQPNSFAHSLTNLLYRAYWAHPLFLLRFGLRFGTLHIVYLIIKKSLPYNFILVMH